MFFCIFKKKFFQAAVTSPNLSNHCNVNCIALAIPTTTGARNQQRFERSRSPTRTTTSRKQEQNSTISDIRRLENFKAKNGPTLV
jgi:hypothetical protein